MLSGTSTGRKKSFKNAPVAQPDRVVASEAIGRGFESLQARHSPCDGNGTLMGQRSHGAARGLSTSLRDGSGASGRGAGTRNGYWCCLERIGPGGAMPVITSGELKTRHRQVRDDQPEGLRVRIHRAISWLARAQREAGDPDATFIFLCIALNAAYAHEFGFEERELVQRDLPSHPHVACLISRT